MNKPAKITGYVATGMLLLNFLIVVVLSVGMNLFTQHGRNMKFTGLYSKAYPVVDILSSLTFLLLAVIYCIVISTRRNHQGKGKVICILFSILYGLTRVIFTYCYPLENLLYSRLGGAMWLGKLSSVRTAISMVTAPFTIVASILICISFGCAFMQGNYGNNE